MMFIKIYKTILWLLFSVIFITGCQSSIPITIHGVPPEAYFQGKKNLDSAYVADNYPLYDTWRLVAMGDPPQYHINGFPIFKHAIRLNLTNEVGALKPQYFMFRFKYSGSKSSYFIQGIYEFDTVGNIYISDISTKEKFELINRPYSSTWNPPEMGEWLWELVMAAEHYTIDGEFLTLFGHHEVLIFTNRQIKRRNRYKRYYGR